MNTVKLPNIIPVKNKEPGKETVKLSPGQTDVFLNNKIEEEIERAINREDEIEEEIEESSGKLKEIIPVIALGETTYKFKIRVVNNQPQLVYEEIA